MIIWGCFHTNGFGPLALVGGTVDQDKYMNILAQNLQTLNGKSNDFPNICCIIYERLMYIWYETELCRLLTRRLTETVVQGIIARASYDCVKFILYTLEEGTSLCVLSILSWLDWITRDSCYSYNRFIPLICDLGLIEP